MIMNPVVQGGAAEEKKLYRITDNAGYGLDGEHSAGVIVRSIEPSGSLDPLVIKAEDGTEIPYLQNPFLSFVMPAQDIKLYYGTL